MARMQIIADARWLTNAVLNVLLFLALLFGGVYMFAGFWWTAATAVLVIFLITLVWRVVR